MASTDQGAAIPIPHGSAKITAASSGTDNAGGRAYAGAHGWYSFAFANDITHGCDYGEGVFKSCDHNYKVPRIR